MTIFFSGAGHYYKCGQETRPSVCRRISTVDSSTGRRKVTRTISAYLKLSRPDVLQPAQQSCGWSEFQVGPSVFNSLLPVVGRRGPYGERKRVPSRPETTCTAIAHSAPHVLAVFSHVRGVVLCTARHGKRNRIGSAPVGQEKTLPWSSSSPAAAAFVSSRGAVHKCVFRTTRYDGNNNRCDTARAPKPRYRRESIPAAGRSRTTRTRALDDEKLHTRACPLTAQKSAAHRNNNTHPLLACKAAA